MSSSLTPGILVARMRACHSLAGPAAATKCLEEYRDKKNQLITVTPDPFIERIRLGKYGNIVQSSPVVSEPQAFHPSV
jgi:hypothetical protein